MIDAIGGMVAWKPRVCGDDVYHHIYAWGNDRHSIFKGNANYIKYISLVASMSSKFEVDIIAYALLQYHVHLFIYDKFNNLSAFMKNLHGEYAKYYNKCNTRVGHIFGERFNNKVVMQDEYATWLSRYIHRQAVEAGYVKNPLEYPWTSYRAYLGLEKRKFLKPALVLDQFGSTCKERLHRYEKFVMGEDDGPIDWCQRSGIVFREEFILEKICRNLGIKKQNILNVNGRKGQYLRHRVINLLLEEYEFTPTRIARMLKITPSMITKFKKTDRLEN